VLAATVEKLSKEAKATQTKLEQLTVMFRTTMTNIDDTVAKKVVDIEERFVFRVKNSFVDIL